MATMGKYCKAYSINELRNYSSWSEQVESTRKEKQEGPDGKEIDVSRALTDNDYLYLQENYVVTDGIYNDENVIFNQVTPEWIAYCKEVLKFEIPSYVSTPIKQPTDPKPKE